MEIKRSKKIHIVVEEEPKRKPSKIPVVEPKAEDPYFKRIDAKMVPGKSRSRSEFLDSLKESIQDKMMRDLEEKMLKEKRKYSPLLIKPPSYDEIVEFGKLKEKPEPEIGLTYEKMQEALKMFRVTNSIVATGRQIGKTRMVFPIDLDNIPSFKLEASGRRRKKEKEAVAEARLENARNTPGNY